MSRTLTLGLSLLMLASLGSTLWIAFDAAQQNTLDLERDLAELTVEAVIREVDTHLGAAQEQVEFLGALIERGELNIDDEQRLTDLMMGALAAAPQVSGIALVRSDYSVLRAGRHAGGLVSYSGSWADREDIREAMASPSILQDPAWRTISWIEGFQAPHVVVAEPMIREDQLLGLVFSIVSVGALSSFLEDFDRANETHSFVLYGRETVLAHPSLAGGFSGLSKDKPLPGLAEVNDAALAAIWGEVIDRLGIRFVDGAPHRIEVPPTWGTYRSFPGAP